MTAAALRLGLLLCLAPVLAPAQSEGAAAPSAQLELGREGRLPGFRSVPLDEDGNPRQYQPYAPPTPPMLEAGAAQLRLLDKMTGLVEALEMTPGETRVAKRLELSLRACRVPEENPDGDAAAYLEIRDLREETPRFSGWMFASSPAISALDHARYDVWVLSCTASAPVAESDSE
jgi:hypothetical protein